MPQVDRIGMGGRVAGRPTDRLVGLEADVRCLRHDRALRSIDTGGHWTLLDTRVVLGSKRFSVAIHPTERRILGYHPFQGVKESSDGLGWTDFSPSAPLHRQSYP
jgi:hypothetical protein